jgi:hypothetical protein
MDKTVHLLNNWKGTEKDKFSFLKVSEFNWTKTNNLNQIFNFYLDDELLYHEPTVSLLLLIENKVIGSKYIKKYIWR